MSSISSRGYSILKDEYEDKDITTIREELTVAPYVIPDYAGPNGAKQTPYKLYKESKTKLYVPKYYGLCKFGPPDTVKVDPGEDIEVRFKGSLRPEQKAPVDAILKACQNPSKMGGILNLTCASGKCLAKNTPILMFNGTIKYVQDVKIGDIIMGDDSTPRKIMTTCRGFEKMYCVHQGSFRDPYIVNASHILSLKYNNKIRDIPILEYLNRPDKHKFKAYHASIEFPSHKEAKHPYELGCNLAGMDENTHILHEYKCGPRLVRSQVLVGFNDTCKLSGRLFTNPNSALVRDLMFIARSLGYDAYVIGSSSNGYRFKYAMQDVAVDIMVEELEMGEYFGFTIDGNHRFVLGDFTVTHNTVLAIHCICHIAKKSLIIVHKDFLLKQWRERIEEFTCGARIGLIKGKTIDIEDKDIVLASLQSLAMKDYVDDVFRGFGVVVIDEVHRTAAEVFCRALGKVVFPVTIGLTATLKRKDGLTKVFIWHLGDVAYSNVVGKDAKKCVNASIKVNIVQYYDPEPSYSKEVMMFRDKLNVSRMINNICDYLPRTILICNLIKEILAIESERRILILSDRKNHLTSLERVIRESITDDIGFYIGGMKEKDLKISEGRKIIIATFAMSAEGLDIKGLDTLILGSPKSDVIQSCGRILRDKPQDRKHIPLIIDIVDMFSLFQKQAKKREAYYKSQNYEISVREVIA